MGAGGAAAGGTTVVVVAAGAIIVPVVVPAAETFPGVESFRGQASINFFSSGCRKPFSNLFLRWCRRLSGHAAPDRRDVQRMWYMCPFRFCGQTSTYPTKSGSDDDSPSPGCG